MLGPGCFHSPRTSVWSVADLGTTFSMLIDRIAIVMALLIVGIVLVAAMWKTYHPSAGG